MARTFQIRASTGDIYLLMLTPSNHLQLRYSAWREAKTDNGHTIFSLGLVGKGTDHEIIDAVRDLEHASDYVRRFWADRYETVYLYLEAQADGESASRIGIIHSISITPAIENNISPLINVAGAVFFDLIVDAEMWEDNASNDLGSGAGSSVTGFGSKVAAVTGGTNVFAPSRIVQAWLQNTEAGHVISDAWVGIAPSYDVGNAQYLNALWEAEAGALGAGYSKTTDANASPASGANNAVTGAVGTSDAIVTEVYVNDIEANSARAGGFLGRYLVLCRCKLSSGNQVQLTLRVGTEGSSYFAARDPVLITHTTYRYIALGELQITGDIGGGLSPETFHRGFQLWALRTGSAVDLTVDCFVIMPSERMVEMHGIAAAQNTKLYWLSPYRAIQQTGFTQVGGSYPINADYTISPMWSLPSNSGYAVTAFNDNATESPTMTGTLQIVWYDRYIVYQEPT